MLNPFKAVAGLSELMKFGIPAPFTAWKYSAQHNLGRAHVLPQADGKTGNSWACKTFIKFPLFICKDSPFKDTA